MYAEPSAWIGGQERAVNPQMVRSPQPEGWTVEDFEGVSRFSDFNSNVSEKQL